MTSATASERPFVRAPLVLREVVARDASGPKGAARGLLYGLSIELPAGVFAFLGAPEDGTIALAEALAGLRSIERGALLVAGEDPWRSPEMRARIGFLGLEAALPAASDVGECISIATTAWPTRPAARELLARLGLGALEKRKLASLSPAEQRALELAIAVAVPEPALLVIVEPFVDVAIVDPSVLGSELAAIAERAPIVIITSSPRDAQLCDQVIVLHRGALVRRSDGAHEKLGASGLTQVTVWITAGARSLVSALSISTSVSSVAFDSDAGDGGVLRASGPDTEALVLAIADAVQASSARVSALAESTPGLAEVRAATEYELRSRQLAAHRARAEEGQAHARWAAQQYAQRPPPPPAPVASPPPPAPVASPPPPPPAASPAPAASPVESPEPAAPPSPQAEPPPAPAPEADPESKPASGPDADEPKKEGGA